MPLHGSCHCGHIAFSIDGDLPEKLTRCTCSFCAKRGVLIAYFAPEQFRLAGNAGGDKQRRPLAQAGLDQPAPQDDQVYRWNTHQVAHHFCRHCGCATFSDSPAFERDGSWDQVTRRFGVNARLFDDFDAATAPVEVIDGKNLW